MLPKEIIAKIRRLEIRTGRMVNEIFAGQYESVFKGRGMEFDEVREYFPGDDIRAIDWNVTARTGHPHVKKFVEERELNIMLLVDASASQRFGTRSRTKAEVTAEIAAVLSYTAVKNNDRVGALLFTDQVEKFIPPAKGTTHLSRILRDVLYAQPRGQGTNFNPALEYLNEVIKRRCIVFLLSDFHTAGYEKALAITNRRHDVIAVEIRDPGEEALPNIPFIAVEDLERGVSRLVPSGSKSVRQSIQQHYQRAREERRRFLRKINVDGIELTTNRSYVEPLVNFFRMRAKRFH
ncbi:DUF58 domain-containing protein [candidate division FCPU426 bacterium]|nr:DUF58 domain-containing protein [candidate division FCPU426 bacterium]